MEALKAYYIKKYNETGVSLTGVQLQALAKEKKWKCTKKQIYQFLREQVQGTSSFARADKTSRYQTIGVLKPGQYFIDYGEFHKNWAKHNKGCTGFLVAVENLTNKLYARPTKGKGTQHWLDTIAQFVELTRDVSTILSDRDSVAQSANFRQEIASKYNIRWHFLRKGHKAFLAERYIGFLKQKLTQAMLNNQIQKTRNNNSGPSLSAVKERDALSTKAEPSDSDDVDGQVSDLIPQNWIQYLNPICNQYNITKIAGTSYRRQAINKYNFNAFVAQITKCKEPELRYNQFVAGPFINPKWNKAIFKFQLGDKVLLSRKANWKFRDQQLGAFGKVTMKGGFSLIKYTISGRQLRANKSYTHYIPVYSLAEFGPHLHFYNNELSLVKH